jgi:hypothetical protein
MMNQINEKKTTGSMTVKRGAALLAIAACTLGGSDARMLRSDKSDSKSDDQASCVTEQMPTDYVRLWGLELGEKNVDKVGGLQCDGDWDDFESNAQYLKSSMWASSAGLLAEEVMPSLEIMGENGGADVYYCPDGVKWYTLNDFQGCSLKDGKSWDYRGKTYKNAKDGSTYVQSVRATLSYVCNKQARIRNVGVSYTAVIEPQCRDL